MDSVFETNMAARKRKAKLFIGTSGYFYPHWRNGVFYPYGLPGDRQLEFYAQRFSTVELNNPFYRLPAAALFKRWKGRVPKGFIFAVKVSRFITHIKYLRGVKTAWETFLAHSLNLGGALGPFLFQLPPNRHKDADRLRSFLTLLKKTDPAYKKRRFAFEFRHPSWFSGDVYELLSRHKNVSLCLADSPRLQTPAVVTGNFVYIRMHGSGARYESSYSEKELKAWAKMVKRWLQQGLDVYVYFNNDARGYAVKNALSLSCTLSGSTAGD